MPTILLILAFLFSAAPSGPPIKPIDVTSKDFMPSRPCKERKPSLRDGKKHGVEWRCLKRTNMNRMILFGRRNIPRWGLYATWKRGKPCGLFIHRKGYGLLGSKKIYPPCKACKVLHGVGSKPQPLSCKVALPYGLFNQGDILFPGQKDVHKDGVRYLCLPQCIKYKLQHVKNGKLHGKEVRWFKNGRVRSVAYFARGKKHGVETAWWPNGQMARRFHYRHGKGHGTRQIWDKQGRQVAYIEFRNGLIHGKSVRWYKGTRQKVYIDYYKYGNQHGISKAWHRNGKPWLVRMYKHGRAHGRQVTYRKDGSIDYVGFVENGWDCGPGEYKDPKGKTIKTVQHRPCKERHVKLK